MEGSINLLSFTVCIGMFLGVTMFIFLLFNKSSKNISNIYLGFLLLTAVLHIISPFFYFTVFFDDFNFLFRVERIGGFVSGPLIYFYICSCIQKDFKIKSILWLHFIPAVLDLLFHIPILNIPAEQKVEYFNSFMETGIFIGHQEPNWIPLAKSLHAFTYSIISTRLVLQYRKHLTDSTSLVDTAYHRWLLIFCTYLIYPLLIIFAFVLFNGNVINLTALYFGFVSFIIAVFVYALIKPDVFHAFPHQMLLPDSTEEKTLKYESSNLQEEQKERYLKILLNYFEKEKPYLLQELTLATIAEQTKIPAHYLSQIINEKMNCTFLDFVNNYRVEEAKIMLASENSKQYTILSIAYDAGFNSKSTFYSAFKKHVGTTPSGYRKNLTIAN